MPFVFESHQTPAIVAVVILYYDYSLTILDEVDRFWTSGSMSWASILFYLNRYLSLLGHIVVMMQYFWDIRRNPSICPPLSLFHQYYSVIIQIIVGSLLILRTYALYDRNRWALLFMLVTSGAIVAFSSWTVIDGVRGDSQLRTGTGCIPPMPKAHAIRFAAAWSGVLVFDNVIFVMTIYKSLQQCHAGNRTLTHVLVRDGAIYFGIMAVITLGNILSFLLPTVDADRGFMTTFTNVISSTMISRLMLNLRNPRLASLSPMQADRSKQVFSTLVTFGPMHASESDSQSITYEEVRPTADARDPNIELTTRNAVSLTQDHHL